MYRIDFWTLWEKARVGWSERTASKHVYYQVWNRSPVQVGCIRQVLRAGALGRPRGMGWGGRWEEGSGWGAHVNSWLIHVNVWQKPLQYCKVISLQLINIKEKKKRKKRKLRTMNVFLIFKYQKNSIDFDTCSGRLYFPKMAAIISPHPQIPLTVKLWHGPDQSRGPTGALPLNISGLVTKTKRCL